MNPLDFTDILRGVVPYVGQSTFSLLPLVSKAFHKATSGHARFLNANVRPVYRYWFNIFEVVENNYTDLLRCLIDLGKVRIQDVDGLEWEIARHGCESMVRLWISKYRVTPRSRERELIMQRFAIEESEFR